MKGEGGITVRMGNSPKVLLEHLHLQLAVLLELDLLYILKKLRIQCR